MILYNKNNDKERRFKLLFKVVKDDKEYIVYEDMNHNIYAGIKKGKKLISLTDSEYEFIEKMFDKIRE